MLKPCLLHCISLTLKYTDLQNKINICQAFKNMTIATITGYRTMLLTTSRQIQAEYILRQKSFRSTK